MDEIIRLLREKNEEVPIPMRLPSDQEISSAESVLNRKFHPDYKQYLREASDVVFGVLEPLVVIPKDNRLFLPKVAKEAWEYGLPYHLLPICEENGDYFAIDSEGLVHFWAHNGTTDEQWPDLATWINKVWLEE